MVSGRATPTLASSALCCGGSGLGSQGSEARVMEASAFSPSVGSPPSIPSPTTLRDSMRGRRTENWLYLYFRGPQGIGSMEECIGSTEGGFLCFSSAAARAQALPLSFDPCGRAGAAPEGGTARSRLGLAGPACWGERTAIGLRSRDWESSSGVEAVDGVRNPRQQEPSLRRGGQAAKGVGA